MSESNSQAVSSSLVLFFGVDLVGSTAFKAKNRPGPGTFHAWLPVFMGFYYQFHARLLEAIQTEKKNGGDFGEDPVFWKAAGDELLFTKTLTDAKQAWRTIRTFRNAVLTYREDLQTKQSSLDVKTYAWIAGFPILNARIPMGDSARDLDIEGEPQIVAYRLEEQLAKEGGRGSIDYLGPSIDLGFRLGKFAERRKFIVSADLAFLLCDQEDKDDKDIKFWYEGRHPLKGVLHDRPYPIFWIEMNSGKVDQHEDAMLKKEDIARSEVRSFCKTFLEDTAGAICLPYIVNGTNSYATIPVAHQAALKDFDKLAAAEAERDAAPMKSASETQETAAPTIPIAVSAFLSKVDVAKPKKRSPSVKKKPAKLPTAKKR